MDHIKRFKEIYYAVNNFGLERNLKIKKIYVAPAIYVELVKDFFIEVGMYEETQCIYVFSHPVISKNIKGAEFIFDK